MRPHSTADDATTVPNDGTERRDTTTFPLHRETAFLSPTLFTPDAKDLTATPTLDDHPTLNTVVAERMQLHKVEAVAPVKHRGSRAACTRAATSRS